MEVHLPKEGYNRITSWSSRSLSDKLQNRLCVARRGALRGQPLSKWGEFGQRGGKLKAQLVEPMWVDTTTFKKETAG